MIATLEVPLGRAYPLQATESFFFKFFFSLLPLCLISRCPNFLTSQSCSHDEVGVITALRHQPVGKTVRTPLCQVCGTGLHGRHNCWVVSVSLTTKYGQTCLLWHFRNAALFRRSFFLFNDSLCIKFIRTILFKPSCILPSQFISCAIINRIPSHVPCASSIGFHSRRSTSILRLPFIRSVQVMRRVQ